MADTVYVLVKWWEYEEGYSLKGIYSDSGIEKVKLNFIMMINQIVEEVRDSKRHGSCGMGIWETVSRYMAKPLTYDLFQFAQLPRYAKVTYLESIRDGYMMDRLKGYGIKSVPAEWKEIVYSVQLIENFIDDIDFMINRVTPAGNLMLRNYKTVIFENGQGLLLDQNQTLYGDNTTPSNTGVINSLNIANSTFDNANMEVCYVSRTYMQMQPFIEHRRAQKLICLSVSRQQKQMLLSAPKKRKLIVLQQNRMQPQRKHLQKQLQHKVKLKLLQLVQREKQKRMQLNLRHLQKLRVY